MGHTLVNGNPVQPYSEDTGFQGMFVWMPDVEDQSGFFNLEMNSEKVVHFYPLIPKAIQRPSTSSITNSLLL